MDAPPPVADGFLRISLRLPRGATPLSHGDVARLSGVPIDDIGPVWITEEAALIDVRAERGKDARASLSTYGPTRLVDWQWRWLRLGIGRNHGFSIGQLRKVMQAADAMPLGKIAINNTHTLIGVQDFKLAAVVARLGSVKINGFALRPEALAPGTGPGSPAFVPQRA